MSLSFSLFKYSRSEVVLTFFERSPLDQVLKNDNVHKIQPSFQSPVKISGKSCFQQSSREFKNENDFICCSLCSFSKQLAKAVVRILTTIRKEGRRNITP